MNQKDTLLRQVRFESPIGRPDVENEPAFDIRFFPGRNVLRFVTKNYLFAEILGAECKVYLDVFAARS